MNALEFVNVTKYFDGKRAVNNFTAYVKPGEIVALLGPNGSGKTTLLRIATGLLRPTHGDVLIFGHSILNDPINAKRMIGFVPDELYAYDVLSGYENIQLIADLWEIDLEEKKDELERLAKILEMSTVLDHAVATYSAGMKRKLNIIMAMIHDPSLLIIDEITSSLDPKALASIELILKGLKQRGVAILFTTHILEVAEVLADRVIIIHKGEKIWEGASTQLRESGERNKRIKDIFFELTGGPEYTLIMEYLKLREKYAKFQ